MVAMLMGHRRMTLRAVGLLIAGLTVTGCATLDKSECRTADWRTIGYEDGARGEAASLIGKHREACAKHGIVVNLAAYRQGREEGLRQYCRAQNGFRLGERGVAYSGMCPADLEPQFRSAYEAGKRVHDAASSVRYAANRLRQKEQQLAHIKSMRQEKQAELVSKGVSTARRAELVAETLELVRDQGAIEAEITQLKADLEVERDQLARVRSTSPYR